MSNYDGNKKQDKSHHLASLNARKNQLVELVRRTASDLFRVSHPSDASTLFRFAPLDVFDHFLCIPASLSRSEHFQALPRILLGRRPSFLGLGTSAGKRPRTKDDERGEFRKRKLALVFHERGFFDLAPSYHRTNSAFRGPNKVPE
jgi:hypothetical protein